MPDRIYIETTIVSYLTGRPSRDVVIAGHQQSTHEWWDTRRTSYELCTSELVFVEAASGDPQAAHDRIAIAADHGIPYLLTWNCRHLANATMRPIIESVCAALGFRAPIICTPEELLGAKP
jgi:hypothetical protein